MFYKISFKYPMLKIMFFPGKTIVFFLLDTKISGLKLNKFKLNKLKMKTDTF